ncbi:hypothetical protein GQ42DRAFT_74520 [Ramicandelaber brevisporus]|nr:hypothetical protein GQ42DRAFT_74520 [Ramicandelaber brevisporus]
MQAVLFSSNTVWSARSLSLSRTWLTTLCSVSFHTTFFKLQLQTSVVVLTVQSMSSTSASANKQSFVSNVPVFSESVLIPVNQANNFDVGFIAPTRLSAAKRQSVHSTASSVPYSGQGGVYESELTPLPSECSVFLGALYAFLTANLFCPPKRVMQVHLPVDWFLSYDWPALPSDQVTGVFEEAGFYKRTDKYHVNRYRFGINEDDIEDNIRSGIDTIVCTCINLALMKLADTDNDSENSHIENWDIASANHLLDSLLRTSNISQSKLKVLSLLLTLTYYLDEILLFNKRIFARSILCKSYAIMLGLTGVLDIYNEYGLEDPAFKFVLCRSTININSLLMFIADGNMFYLVPSDTENCFQYDSITGVGKPGDVTFILLLSANSYANKDSTRPNLNTHGHWVLSKDSARFFAFISNKCPGCGTCCRHDIIADFSDKEYQKMVALVPERGVFKLYFDWRLILLYIFLTAAVAVTLYYVYQMRAEGIDPGGLTGTIVVIAIASIGFVRELFYPETELRDFLRAKVAITKFSNYCRQKGICNSCVTALAIKHRAGFGPVTVGPFASIAGGKPGPAESGKIFMDEPCDIKCLYIAGFALSKHVQFISRNTNRNKPEKDEVKVDDMTIPAMFQQLVTYKRDNQYSCLKRTDYFLIGMDAHMDYNVPSLVHGIATVQNDKLENIEWLPIPMTGVVLPPDLIDRH